MAVVNLADDAGLARPSTATAIAPDWSSSASRFSLSSISLIAASIITSLEAGEEDRDRVNNVVAEAARCAGRSAWLERAPQSEPG